MRDKYFAGPSRWGFLWDMAGNALLLGGILAGFAASFFSLYSAPLEVGEPNALALFYARSGGRLTGYVLLLALAALLVWSLPRLRAPAVGLLCAGWAGLTWYFWEGFSNGTVLTAHVIANLFAQRVDWTAPVELSLELELPVAEKAAAVETFALLTCAMLALLLGGAVVRSRLWWLALFFTLPPLLPGLLADFYPSWPAFLTLAACWCAMLLTDLCRDAVPASRGKLTLLALALAGGVLAVCFCLTPQEGYTRPQWTYTAAQALEDFGNKRLTFLDSLEGPFKGRVTYVGAAERADIANAGPLNFTGRTVLKVTADWNGYAYLRGASLARYEDGVWLPLEDGAYDGYAKDIADRAEEGGEDVYDGSPLFFTSQNNLGRAYTVTVENTGASGACVYAPYQLTEQDWAAAGVLPVEDSYLAHEKGLWSHTLSFTPLPMYWELASAAGPEVYLAMDSYRANVLEHYKEVPEEFERFVNEEWEDAAVLEELCGYIPAANAYSSVWPESTPADNPVHCAMLLAGYLRTYQYDPYAPAAPAGVDPVQYFLQDSQRGYCMHFASAATLLLRMMGIPARYVSGFTTALVDGKTVEVPDYAAHAWVEVWMENVGWYPVEVTPDHEPYEVGGGPASQAPAPSAAPTPSREPEETPEPTPAGTDAPEDPEDASGGRGILAGVLAALRAVLAIAALAALLWLGQAVPKAVRASHLNAGDVNRAVLDGYRYLERLSQWGVTVPEYAGELAQKARFSGRGLSEEERGAMRRMLDDKRRFLGASLKGPARLLFKYWWGCPERGQQTTEGEDERDDTP